jgi:hypothetical protein
MNDIELKAAEVQLGALKLQHTLLKHQLKSSGPKLPKPLGTTAGGSPIHPLDAADGFPVGGGFSVSDINVAENGDWNVEMKKGSTTVEVLKSGSGMKTQFIVKENGKEVMKLGFPEGNIKGKINEYLSEKHEIDFSRAPKPGIYTLSDGSKVTGVFFWGMK